MGTKVETKKASNANRNVVGKSLGKPSTVLLDDIKMDPTDLKTK
jgi:hypothetical protein